MTAKKKKPKAKTAKFVHVQKHAESTVTETAAPLENQAEPLTITEDVQADDNAFYSRPENKSWFQWLCSLFS